MTTKWVMDVMEKLAPACLAYESDNVGLLVGEKNKPVNKILVALELTDDVLDEAILLKSDMVITHHPIMRHSIKKITDETLLGQKIIKLIRNKISFYAAHTNLDATAGGVNDRLFDVLGLTDRQPFMPLPHSNDNTISMGRIGALTKPMETKELLKIIKSRLELGIINYVGDENKTISKVALCTGSASNMDFIELALIKGCDVLISGDLTYHNAQTAFELGLVVIDGTHFATEVIIADVIINKIKQAAAAENIDIEIIKSLRQKSPFKQA